jgi:general secretion pathway protein L
MISDYVTWWAEQMLQWLPARLAGQDRDAAHALIVAPIHHTPRNDGAGRDDGTGGQEVEVVLRRHRRDRALGRFALDGAGLRRLQAAVPPRARPRSIVLRLPPHLLLEREIVLPLAAEREPERVLAYEMDRITPFATADIFWTYAVQRRDRTRGKLHLRLSIVTRDAVQPLLGALAQAGLGATLIEVAGQELGGAAATPRRIALRRPDSRRARAGRRAVAAAAIGCALLAVAAAGLPFILQAVAERAVEARIAALRGPVAEAESLRRRIAARTAGVDVIAAERARLGDPLAVLAAVTDLLPDDAYLTDFALRQGKLMLNGQSAAAARLIAAFSADPVIRNPDFAAPVTRIENGRADLFAIRAEIAPGAAQ